MSSTPGPLLTRSTQVTLHSARQAGRATLALSLDLGRSTSTVQVGAEAWVWDHRVFPYPEECRERTVYYWSARGFQPVARFAASFVKLVPTEWGAPTFEIDGIKMLPTARISPYADAEHKVGLIQPHNKVILDTCGGLGYFAAWCLHRQAARVHSFEKNLDVIWLRSVNPWSPDSDWARAPAPALTLTPGDIATSIGTLPAESFDAILHDPPRFGIAGELYSQQFYDQLARVLRRGGRMFHYTGRPNQVARGRDLAGEVAIRLRRAGFKPERAADGLLAIRAAAGRAA